MDSVAVENYLKSIWQLGPNDVATLDLAQHLNVAPASATKMIQRLTEKGLVNHIPYRGASLTSEGERRALSVVRRLRLLETFLAQTLDSGETVDKAREGVVAKTGENVSVRRLKNVSAENGVLGAYKHGDRIALLTDLSVIDACLAK